MNKNKKSQIKVHYYGVRKFKNSIITTIDVRLYTRYLRIKMINKIDVQENKSHIQIKQE